MKVKSYLYFYNNERNTQTTWENSIQNVLFISNNNKVNLKIIQNLIMIDLVYSINKKLICS